MGSGFAEFHVRKQLSEDWLAGTGRSKEPQRPEAKEMEPLEQPWRSLLRQFLRGHMRMVGIS